MCKSVCIEYVMFAYICFYVYATVIRLEVVLFVYLLQKWWDICVKLYPWMEYVHNVIYKHAYLNMASNGMIIEI